MTIDISRKSFDHSKNYNALISEQGRVQLDSDWNEAADILDRRLRVETLDTFGRCRVPQETPDAFRIAIDNGGLLIGLGRMYVDGLLAENHGEPTDGFNPVLAELTGTNALPFEQQPFQVNASANNLNDGRYLIFLDVWYRDVTVIGDPDLLEKAVGVPTASRRQTVWQVKIHDEDLDDGVVCATDDETIPGWLDQIQASDGRLSTQAVGVPTIDDPCLLPPSGGYRGLENRTYRVEIHSVDAQGNSTFKWSRDNATVASAVNAIPSNTTLIVESVGRDSILRFNAGEWVEILDDAIEFSDQPGIIRRIETVDDSTNTITLTEALPANVFATVDNQGTLDSSRHTRIRRWDQSGEIRDTNNNLIIDLDGNASEGVIPVPAAGTSIVLEDGVQITFEDFVVDNGRYKAGDFWLFIARTIDASVQELDDEPPCGIHHHYCRLAIAEIANGAFVSVSGDCRDLTPNDPVNSTGCCTVVVRPGENIQAAIDSLPEAGGCVCLKPGLHEINDEIRIENSNIELHGESKGVIVRRIDNANALSVANPAGLIISGIAVLNIQFEFNNTDIDGSSNSAMLALDRCQDVIINGCGFMMQRAEPLMGVRIGRSSHVQLENCEFATVMIGVWVVEGSSALSILHNRFNIAGTEGGDGGIVGLFLESAFGPSRIIGNEINGYIFGISLNPNTLSSNSGNASRAIGSIIAENQISRSSVPGTDSNDRKAFAIDVAASRCIIKDNRITYASHVYGGIHVTGNDCLIENNHLRLLVQQADAQPSIGILSGVADSESLRIVQGNRIQGNHVSGPQNAIVVFQNNGINISDNQLDSPREPITIGIILFETDRATVDGNRIENALFAVGVSQGDSNSVVNNELRSGGSGLTAFQQTTFEFSHNRVDNMRDWGFLGLQFVGSVAITHNRITSCGYQQTPAIGIGVSGVSGELAIESCQVIDTGVSPDGSIINQPAWQIIGDLVLQCKVQGNLVNYSNAALLATNLEDRALWLRGFIDFQSTQNNIQQVFGFSAHVLDNKFLGTGLTALVEFQELRMTDNAFIRFERVFFNNNFCWHVSSTPTSQRATVKLAGRSAIVMGNHIKANNGFSSVDFQDVPGVFVGNITEGGTLNFNEFPVPEQNFNRQ
ncbi:MAG: DUF6519 domain-containing protein [Gammaproteobacteria bacterium]|nr:DUF6519 domain-containing protein [Gammaproteobacteria bacterium]